MPTDPTSAAWGAFQVKFAFLVQELASAVFYMRRRREAKLQFQQIFGKPLEKLIAALTCELNHITAEGHTEMEIEELRALCDEIKALKEWRDPRIHARVSFDNGIALYNWKTRKQLEMSPAECDKKSDQAVSIAVRIAGGTRSLLHHLKADETLVSEIQILLDPPDELG